MVTEVGESNCRLPLHPDLNPLETTPPWLSESEKKKLTKKEKYDLQNQRNLWWVVLGESLDAVCGSTRFNLKPRLAFPSRTATVTVPQHF